MGYCGGQTENPTYESVCYTPTGHAETLEIEFDPAIVSFNELLVQFWSIHDASQPRGGLKGQYRSAVFCTSQQQLEQATASRDAVQAKVRRPIATEITELKKFWRAEEYHQKYYAKHRTASCRL